MLGNIVLRKPYFYFIFSEVQIIVNIRMRKLVSFACFIIRRRSVINLLPLKLEVKFLNIEENPTSSMSSKIKTYQIGTYLLSFIHVIPNIVLCSMYSSVYVLSSQIPFNKIELPFFLY